MQKSTHGSWEWCTQAGHPYLTATLLNRWPHGFFTRESWPQAPEVLSQQLAPAAVIYRAQQVHGNRVLSPNDFSQEPLTTPNSRPAADAVMTTGSQQAAWVCTADCTPVLIGDVATGQVAAVHAGWRGTALRIVPTTIDKMQAQGSELKNLRIAMGPAISGQVYQVSTQVATEVGRSLRLPAQSDAELVDHLQALTPAPLLPDTEPGRLRLDVRQINALQLLALGLDLQQIEIAPHCTYQEPDRFFSYRRSHEKKVQWSGIVSC